MKIKTTLGVLIVIICLSLVSASFSLGEPKYQIDKSYAPGDNLRGWINVKLSAEPDGLITDNKGGSASLLSLLKNSSSISYTCSPANCMKDYSASNPQTSKTINAVEEQIILVGAKIEGNLSIDGVLFFNLTFHGDAPADCRNQISVDLLDNGTVEIENKKASSSVCAGTKSFGCYDSSKPSVEANLYEKPYCQKVHLRPAPAYELGLNLKRVGSEKTVRMLLYTLGNATVAPAKVGECSLENKLPHDFADDSCILQYSLNTEGDYLVCALSDGQTEYKIKAYQDLTSGCGFSGKPEDKIPMNFAYSIFAQSKKYDVPGAVSLTEDYLSSWSLGPRYNEYIKKKYGNMDCTGGCIIPIKIISHSPQKIILKDLKVTYSTIGLGVPTKTEIYDLGESPVTISTTDFQKVSIDSGKFLVSNNFGEETVSLSLNGNALFSDTISVKQVPTPTAVNPTSVPAAVPTDFVVVVPYSEGNITGYQWDFGDGKVENTIESKATHSYAKVGSFILTVSVTNANNEKGVKIFNISVQSPQGFVNTTLKEKKDLVEEIKNSIKSDFSPFEQTAITKALDVPYLEEEIQRVQVAYAKAGNNTNTYVQLMTDLINLKIPDQVLVGKSSEKLQIYPNQEIVDFDLYNQVESGLNYSGEDFPKLVSRWNLQNLETFVTYKEILAVYDGKPETIVNSFDIELKKKTDFDYSPILFMERMEEMALGGEYNERNLSEDYIYFPLKDNVNRLVFTTTDQEADFTNLPIFVAPGLENLGIQEKPEEKNSTPIWIWFAIALGALLVVMVVVYIFLQKWYSSKYEAFLFKDKNEFYNIAAFIENAKKSGQSDSEIEKRLKKAGWSSEQVKFAMKKYSGKETGMAKLPLTDKVSSKKQQGSLPSLNQRKVFRK